MKQKQEKNRWLAAFTAAACMCAAGSALPQMQASAKEVLVGYLGDIDHDMDVDISDAVLLGKYLVRTQTLTEDCKYNADVNADGQINVFDMVFLKKILLGRMIPGHIYMDDGEPDEPEITTTQPIMTTTTETTTTTTVTTTVTTPIPPDDGAFITPPIAQLDASLPTQGRAEVVVFYVDFPDCPYQYAPSVEELQTITFGAEDESSAMYPFESISAYFSRASKGQLTVSGKVFRYTAKENKAAYEDDVYKIKLTEECYQAFADSEDFSKYDGDGDRKIDCTLLNVPTEAGEENWWPCAGGFGDYQYRVDGMSIGHLITGNAQVAGRNDFGWYTSSYIHEMGHCTGLPDYYLYGVDDYEGMHGVAGTEMMDADACSDFSAFTKLMLGWYRESQIQVYDPNAGTQAFTLYNAQTDAGNCVVIPHGTWNGNYFSEYFIVEYASLDRNNSNIGLIAWWQQQGSGVRVHHIDATLLKDYWGSSFKYASGSEYTENDNGRRLIRITQDTDGADNFYQVGAVINNTISGFAWYDGNNRETIDPKLEIRIVSQGEDCYNIEISAT